MRIEIRGVLPGPVESSVPCTTRCAAICKWPRRNEKEGRSERYKQAGRVCVRAGASTVVSRDCKQQQQ